jgi:hypothetical protein
MMTAFNRPLARTASPLSDPPPMRRSPQRISITLNWALHQKLMDRCDIEGRSLSNLAAHLLEIGTQER